MMTAGTRLVHCVQEEMVLYPAQVVDQDLYKLSVQLFRQDRDRRPAAVTSLPVMTLPTTTVQ